MFQKIKALYIENRIWIQPIKYVVVSFIISIIVVLIDARVIPMHDYIPEVFLTSVELAIEILSTLSGALLTMTTFTFSTIMVVLTTYSSDFTPRVVENFLTDESTTKVLGIFVGGFFYCITSLFFMRNSLSEYSIIAATIAIIYSVVCIFYFIAFVYSVSSSIQVSKLISRLFNESSQVIDETIKFREEHKMFNEKEIEIHKSKADICANDNGYLQDIDFERILNHIDDMNCEVIVSKRIGEFISKSQIVATIYYNQYDITDTFSKKISNCFVLEEEKNAFIDYNFSIQKIIEIALRAISPGINDPNTSVQCIKNIGVLLGELSRVNGNLISIEKDDSKSKIIYKDIDLKNDIYFTFYQIVHYGKEDISIVIALFEALDIIIRKATFENMPIIKEFSNYVYDMTIENYRNSLDREILIAKNESIQAI